MRHLPYTTDFPDVTPQGDDGGQRVRSFPASPVERSSTGARAPCVLIYRRRAVGPPRLPSHARIRGDGGGRGTADNGLRGRGTSDEADIAPTEATPGSVDPTEQEPQAPTTSTPTQPSSQQLALGKDFESRRGRDDRHQGGARRLERPGLRE